MHQTQWVRAHARSLDEALEAFMAHVTERGHADNWWKWSVARLADGSLVTRPLESWELADLEPDELTGRTRALDAAKTELAEPSRWLANAWCEVWAQLGLEGVSPLVLGARSESERATLERVFTADPRRQARRFLELLVQTQRASYGSLDLDARGPLPLIESPLRVARAIALERVHHVVLGEDAAAIDALPFLRHEAPDDWPAHLLGSPELPVIHLAVDMHL